MARGASADRPPLWFDPGTYLAQGMKAQEIWRKILDPDSRHPIDHSAARSDAQVANAMKLTSDWFWKHNEWLDRCFYLRPSEQIPIQKLHNNRLWTLNPDGRTLDHITSDDIAPLFDSKDPKDWPHIIYTSNHARAWETKDLVEMLKGVEQLGRDANGGKPLDIYRAPQEEAAPATKPASMAGKTIVLLACSTRKDIFLNGWRLFMRRIQLKKPLDEEDGVARSAEEREVDKAGPHEYQSPAAIRLAKLLMKIMAEPECRSLINLDCASTDMDRTGTLKAHPLIIDHIMRMGSEDSRFTDLHPIILRDDAVQIAAHCRGIGFSLGCNTVTEVSRFLKQECEALHGHLKIRDGGALRDVTEADITAILSALGLMNIAPGEVPLSKTEIAAGMDRATIHNSNDEIAGPLVADAQRYDPVHDRFIVIKGPTKNFGHGIEDTLGADGKSGYIMDQVNQDKPGYAEAKAEVEKFYAPIIHAQAEAAARPVGPHTAAVRERKPPHVRVLHPVGGAPSSNVAAR